MRLFSKDHKELVGSLPDSDTAFKVTFDETGHAEIEDEAVGNYLLQLRAASLAQPVEDGTNKKPEDMNVPQLKKFAKDNGIEIGEASKKDEILPIVQAFLEQKVKEVEKQGQGGAGTGDQ